MNRAFHRISSKAADWFGSPWAFVLAIIILVVWGITGPIFHFSDTWQLFANTATNIITFLMVFVIQNSQNRDSKAIQLKLAELIRATEGTRNAMVNIEDLSDEQMARLREEFERMGRMGGTESISDVADIDLEDLQSAEDGAEAAEAVKLKNLEDQLPPDTPSHPG